MYNTLNISQQLSKTILNSIIEDKDINYDNLSLKGYSKKIELLRKEYKKLNFKKNNQLKYQKFWLIAKKKYGETYFKTVQRNQETNDNKFNMIFSEFNLSLGFTPSLLTLLLFSKEVKAALKYNDFYNSFLKAGGIDHSSNNQKLILTKCLNKKIQLITPLCPDYEHVKVAKDLYKYTFNKLNNGVGLIGQRLMKVINDLYSVLKNFKIEFDHYVYYGDFEGYSKIICNRLNESEPEFIEKVSLSCQSMKSYSKEILGNNHNRFNSGMIVRDLLGSKKKEWITKLEKNNKLLRNIYKKDINFRRKVLEIAKSRRMLYSSWFPSMDYESYTDIVINQGAEYLLMSDLFKEKFKNPVILGFDHPKMGFFYSIKNAMPILYGRPHYE